MVAFAPAPTDDHPSPLLPDAVAIKKLETLRNAALLGNRVQLKDYMKADIATFWPQLAGKVVITQGDGADALTRAEFAQEFEPVYTQAAGSASAAQMRAAMNEEYRQSQLANDNGVPITRALTAPNGARYSVISMPSSLCLTCDKIEPAKSLGGQCKPQHPDLSYFESHRRFYVVFHEQAHTVRHLLGMFNYNGEVNRHREEVTANLYAQLRMIQLFGQPAVYDLERRLTHEPVSIGASRHYVDAKSQQDLLRWYGQNAKALARMHPHVLLEQAGKLAEPHLLGAEQLVSIAKFEAQVPFVALGSEGRLKLLGSSERETVRDAKSCKWNYPAVMQQIDREHAQLRQKYDGATTRYYQTNPYRPQGLRGLGAFSYNPQDEVQVGAMLEFNNRVKGPMCEAFVADDLTAKKLAPPAGSSGKMPEPECPQ